LNNGLSHINAKKKGEGLELRTTFVLEKKGTKVSYPIEDGEGEEKRSTTLRGEKRRGRGAQPFSLSSALEMRRKETFKGNSLRPKKWGATGAKGSEFI